MQDLKAGGLGNLGAAQLQWLERDLQGRSASQPIIVFAHVPLWTVSQEWGWGTDDGAQALELLKRFGSVTVLNGHIHQIMQKVEGNIAFHTAARRRSPSPRPEPRRHPARSRTCRRPAPLHARRGQGRAGRGQGAAGHHRHPARRMTRRAILGAALLIAGSLAAGAAWAADAQVTVDNFTFSPPTLTVPAGTKVTWTNHDDIPHKIVGSNDPVGLNSPVLDTDESFSTSFVKPGTYAYFCSLHPHMQGKVIVR